MNHPMPPETSPVPLAPGQRLQESTRQELSPGALEEIKALAGRYPERLSATLPALYVAQRDFGFLSLAAMRQVAKALQVPEGHIFGVATFYTMFKKHPVGKYHLQVCTNLGCALRGAVPLLKSLCAKAKVEADIGISEDGLFSIEEVECLGSCGSGPCLQVNEDVFDELLDEAKLEAILKSCRRGERKAWGER
jgi:NADH:ubiquinone oxidoreductase subunit E